LEAVRAEEADRRSRLHALDVELERLRLRRRSSHARSRRPNSRRRCWESGRRTPGARPRRWAEEIRELASRGEELRSRGEAAAAEQAELAAAIRDRQAARVNLQDRAAALGAELEAAGRGAGGPASAPGRPGPAPGERPQSGRAPGEPAALAGDRARPAGSGAAGVECRGRAGGHSRACDERRSASAERCRGARAQSALNTLNEQVRANATELKTAVVEARSAYRRVDRSPRAAAGARRAGGELSGATLKGHGRS